MADCYAFVLMFIWLFMLLELFLMIKVLFLMIKHQSNLKSFVVGIN
jgi:hypothetical protein